MIAHATGTFDVTLSPQLLDATAANPELGRMPALTNIDKRYSGDLEATSKGQMLSALTEVKGSAGYVAMERVTGTLAGRSGTFALQHSGSMTRGTPQLSVTVVPDSGTGELVGITGQMTIGNVEGKHQYDFEYTLAQ